PTDPCNLFIKNLDDCVISTSEELKNLFESFGQVASAHLATYPESKISRGYGFVAFAKAEDAAKAKDKINNILVGKKRVFVSYAERKEDRAKRLKSIFQGKNPDEEEDDEVKKETDEAGEADEAVATTDEEGNNGKNMMKEEPIDASIVIEVSTTADVEESLKAKEEEELPVASKKVATESGSKRGGVSRNKAQVGGQKGTTTKGFKSTPLDKITEVEEEKVVPTEKSVGDSDATSGVVPEVAVTPSLDALAKVPAPLGRTNKADAEGTGSKASTGGGNNKRSTRRSAGTQKITSSQVQTAVPSLKQISSLGRSSSRIPVQNMGGPLQNIPPTGPRLNNDVTTQNQGNPTATTIAAAAGGPNHYPKRRGGYKGNNPRNGRSLVDKSGADGATGQKEGEQKGTGGVKKTVTGQVGTAPVAAH
ncbi:hypothetical protein BZA05DRAFT_262890, partial [Tricharina praecox]|uniref:uncharacterized protein n=1 Tax=Tricharina praecox TaxID=43433 RepID=UPI00221F63A4